MLTPDIKKRLGEHVATKWTERDGGCPMCACTEWEAHGYVHVMLSDSTVNENHSARPLGFPCAAMICKRCGYTAMLNLLRAGIVQ